MKGISNYSNSQSTMVRQCCCNESETCVYHVIKYLYRQDWKKNFNGLNNEKIVVGTYPLSKRERLHVLKAHSGYKRQSSTFSKMCYKIPYRPQHRRNVTDPNICCKCRFCLGDNLSCVKQFTQFHTGKFMKVLI